MDATKQEPPKITQAAEGAKDNLDDPIKKSLDPRRTVGIGVCSSIMSADGTFPYFNSQWGVSC